MTAQQMEVRRHRSYGGVVRNGKFERAKVERIEDFSDADKQAILADIAHDRQQRLLEVTEKVRRQQSAKKLEDARLAKLMEDKENEIEAHRLERKKQLATVMTEWAQRMKAQEKEKQARDDELVQALLQKEQEKKELAKKREEERVRDRDRRLAWAAKQKAKLEAQMAFSQEAQRKGLDPLELNEMRAAGYNPQGVPDATEFGAAAAANRRRPASAVAASRPRSASTGNLRARPASAASRLASAVGSAEAAAKQKGLHLFARGLERAKGSYADCGRPSRPQSAPAARRRSRPASASAATVPGLEAQVAAGAATRPTSAPSAPSEAIFKPYVSGGVTASPSTADTLRSCIRRPASASTSFYRVDFSVDVAAEAAATSRLPQQAPMMNGVDSVHFHVHHH